MKNTLLALAVLIIPALAQAADRTNRPYSLVNGRSAGTAAAIASQAVAAPAAPKTTAAAATTTTQHAPSGGTSVTANSFQAAVGRRASGGRPQGHKSFWAGKRSAAGDGTTTEAPPPYFSKPGALIRTAGQQPQYAEASPTRTHTVEGGSFVDINNSKAVDVGRSPGLSMGAKDTPPPPNAGSSSRSGGNSITPNSTTNNTTSNTTINGNQSGGSGNGNSNNNGFGGGTGFDPAF